MDLKVVGKCFVKQWSCIDEVGNKLPVKSILFCNMTPFIITKDGNIDKFEGGKMDDIYQADDQYLIFFEEQVRELQAEKSHSIIARIFPALTGSRHKTRMIQVTGKPPTPVTIGTATPITATDAKATPVPVKVIPDLTLLAPLTVIPMQPPMTESQLAGSYINNPQVNDSSNISVCSLDSDAQENLKSHFNDRLSDKYTIHLESCLAM